MAPSLRCRPQYVEGLEDVHTIVLGIAADAPSKDAIRERLAVMPDSVHRSIFKREMRREYPAREPDPRGAAIKAIAQWIWDYKR